MATTFGNRPEDSVADSRGNVLSGVVLQFYPTRADADARTSMVGTASTGSVGTWSFSDDAGRDVLWVRNPAGQVWSVSSDDALAGKAEKTYVDDALAAKADSADLAAKQDAATLDGDVEGLAADSGTTLGAHLKNTYVAQGSLVVNVKDHGAVGDGTTDDTAEVNAALAAAAPGANVYFPPGTYLISGPLTVAAPCAISPLTGRVSIVQATWGKPVFDINNVDDVSISRFDLSCSAARAVIAGTVRDGAAKTYAVGVWAAANRLRVSDVSASGFTGGVRLTNWVNSLGARSGFVDDCLVEDLRVSGVDWGVVGTGWRRAVLRGISGNYSLSPSSPDPAHLIYVADGEQNQDVTVTDCAAFDGTDGHAYQFKKVDGLVARGLSSRACAGILTLRDVQNADIRAVRAFSDATPSDGSIFVQGAGTEYRIDIGDVYIQAAPDTAVIRLDGDRFSLRNVLIDADQVTTSQAFLINAYGGNGLIENVRERNNGSAIRCLIQAVGSNTTIRGVESNNTRSAVQVYSGATGTVIEYDPSRVVRNVISGARSISVSAALTTTILRPSRNVVDFATGSGAQVRAYADSTTHARVTVSGATAFTIADPIEPHVGATLTYLINNATAGAIGTITWSTGHKLTTAWVNPAAGATTAITFTYDGTAWREVARA